MGDGNGASGNGLAALLDKLENKIVMLIAATVLGIGGNQVLTKMAPETVRPDPWTGNMADKAHDHMQDEWRRMFHRHENRIQRSMQETREEMRQLVDTINLHAQTGAHPTADSRLTRLEADIARCEQRHD